MPNDRAFEHAYAVILAGGSGTRFWPLSRRGRPKQLLQLFGRDTLLEQTVARIRRVIPAERIYVFTSKDVRSQVVRLLNGIPPRQVVAEPASRNTAPTIGLAAHEILRQDPAALMIVLPSDHLIRQPARFHSVLSVACRWASTEDRSVVLGLEPTRPDTGYGYILQGAFQERLKKLKIFRVGRFVEKPSLEVARRYLKLGNYLWNSGIFIWRASTLLRNLGRFQPRMARTLGRIASNGGVRNRASFERLYPRLDRVSIDYALMERISNVFVVPADIGWSDVGSWSVAYELHQKDQAGNVRPSQSLCLDSRGNLIVSPKKFAVALGVHNLTIVDSVDALLVCARDRSQDVGKVVEELKRRGRDELL